MRLLNLLGMLTIALFTFSLSADTVLLSDGTEHEGKVVKETPKEITFAVRVGNLIGSVVISKADIISLKYGDPKPDAVAENGLKLKQWAEAEKEPAKAALAWQHVGEFYDRHLGYSEGARASYEKVLRFDLNHAIARSRLGFVKNTKGLWAKAEVIVKKETMPEVVIVKRVVPIVPAAPIAPIVPVADPLVIGLRQEVFAIKKIIEEDIARLKAERERLQREIQLEVRDRNVWITDQFELRDGYYTYYRPTSLLYYTDGLCGYSRCSNYDSPRYGYSQSGCNTYSNSYYNSGQSLGFRGSIGSVKFRGRFN